MSSGGLLSICEQGMGGNRSSMTGSGGGEEHCSPPSCGGIKACELGVEALNGMGGILELGDEAAAAAAAAKNCCCIMNCCSWLNGSAAGLKPGGNAPGGKNGFIAPSGGCCSLFIMMPLLAIGLNGPALGENALLMLFRLLNAPADGLAELFGCCCWRCF